MIDSQRYQELERNYSITVRADGYLRQFETEDEEYAILKIVGLKMCESYNLQYGTIICEALEL